MSRRRMSIRSRISSSLGSKRDATNFVPNAILAENGFDFVYYLQNNPDVVISNADPLQHFETIGWKDGRDPNAYFDTDGYLANYPDVKAAGVNPLDHYHTSGWRDGRDPSVNFDTTSYLAAYPDIAVGNADPLKHFILYGLAEGRPGLRRRPLELAAREGRACLLIDAGRRACATSSRRSPCIDRAGRHKSHSRCR